MSESDDAWPEDWGFETMLRAHSNNIKTRGDVAMILVHWRLLRYGFRCIGDSVFLYKVPSELLPRNIGWDGQVTMYKVKYSFQGNVFLLELTVRDDRMDVRLFSDDTIVATTLSLTSAIGKDLSVNMSKVNSLSRKIDKRIVQKMLCLLNEKKNAKPGNCGPPYEDDQNKSNKPCP